MNEAAHYDRKIIIEQGVGGKRHKAREIECAVLGNDEPKRLGLRRGHPGQGVLRLQRQVHRRRLRSC